MKMLLLFLSLFILKTGFAREVKLLDCNDRSNALSVSIDDESAEVNIVRSSWQSELQYVDRRTEVENFPVIVHGSQSLEYSAVLTNATVERHEKALKISFNDTNSTKMRIVLEKINEGLRLHFESSNHELVESLLRALSVTRSEDISYYSVSDEACVFRP